MFPILQMQGISKRFGTVLANDNVTLNLYGGEIHALLGENGAGKSTLMNILLGTYKPNTGQIYYKDKEVSIKSPKDAARLGFGMVHQNFELVQTLTVAENICLCMDSSKFFIDKELLHKQISEISEQFGLPVDPKAKIWQLSVGEQQRVEIIKLLCRESEILILDEPTAILTPQEARELFRTLRKMADEGKSVIFISHKLNETMENADRITVLRGGKVEDSMLVEEASISRLTKAVVGNKSMQRDCPPPQKNVAPEPCVTVENLNVKNDKDLIALRDVSFTMNSGEIFAIAGVSGNGQRELSEALAGIRKIESGAISIDGKNIASLNVKERIGKGIAFIPEDRRKMGLVLEMNMHQNTIMRDCSRPPYCKGGILNKKAIKNSTKKHVKEYAIKSGGLDLPVGMMSGGNQQKLLVAREIDRNPKLIIAAYPVRGLDIGATETINSTLLAQRDIGACVLFISEDLDEIFSIADRIAVLCDGKLMGIRDCCNTDYEEIGRMMSGEVC